MLFCSGISFEVPSVSDFPTITCGIDALANLITKLSGDQATHVYVSLFFTTVLFIVAAGFGRYHAKALLRKHHDHIQGKGWL